MVKKINQYKNSDKLNIVCVGLYNHGKSSLLNVLVDDLTETTFKVADIRETTDIKEIEKDNKLFVDTPGLDAIKEDDEKVKSAVLFRDFVLFVHNVATGELSRKEVEVLEELKKEFGGNIFVVLSRIDQVDKNTLSRTKEKIQSQIGNLEIFEVSVKRYIKGKKENKKLLIKRSGVEKLKEKLDELDFKAIREKRIKCLKEKIIKDIQIKKSQLETELKKVRDKKEAIKRDIHSILESTKNKIKGV
ncbi:GTPase [Caminibacter pacificus]